MSVYAEIWSRPGDPSFGRVIDDPPWTSHGMHSGLNLVGDGNGNLPDTFDRLDEILLFDPDTPANSTASLVRLFDDSDPDTPFHEWFPRSVVPAESKGDFTVDLAGPGVAWMLDWAKTDAFDFDGTDDWLCADCDWQWGGRDRIRNGGLEDEPLGISNQGFEDGTADPWWAGALAGVSADVAVVTLPVDTGTYALEIDPILAEGGASTNISVWPNKEYTVTFRFRGAAGIEYQFGASGPSTMLAASPATVVEVEENPNGGYEAQRSFTATGGVYETVTLTFTTAAGQKASQISVRNAGAGSWDQDNYLDVVTVSGFGIGTDPWQPTQSLINVTQSEFEASADQAFTGSYSLKVKALYGHGAYYRVGSVNPGVTYTATVRVGHASASDFWGLQVKDVRDQVLGSAFATVGTGAWSTLTITFRVPDFLPGNENEVTLNVLNFGTTFFPTAYIDDLEFYQGQQPTTIGDILGDLYASYVDSTLRTPIVWDDGSATNTPFLTLDFTDSVDSNGVAWWVTDHEFKVWMRMSFLQVVERAARDFGYEWRVVPDNVEAGTWKLQVYNPGTMKTDYTAAASPAVQGGADDTRRRYARFLPETAFLVEGENRITGRDQDSTLMTAIGRIEGARLGRTLPDQPSVLDAAAEDVADVTANSASYPYKFVNPQDIPAVAYKPGDLLTIHDPPEIDTTGRCVDIVGSFSPTREEWDVEFAAATAVGS